MAGTEGTAVRSDDPARDVLDDALSEMVAEGFDPEAIATAEDLPQSAVSQPTTDASAAPQASDPVASVGDQGPAAVSADDPYKGSSPFTYKSADGSDKPLDGVYRFPGEGLLVPEDKVASIEQLASSRDAMERQVREITDRASTLERLSEWRTKGPDGQEQTYRGEAGIALLRAEHATKGAALDTLIATINDPAKFARLVEIQIDPTSSQGYTVTPSKDALERLLMESEIAEGRAQQQVVQQLSTLRQPPAPAAPDFAAKHGEATITQLAGDNAAALTPEDRAALLAQFNQFVTPDGKSILPGFQTLVLHMAGQSAKAREQVAAAEKAGKLNAGMDAGRIRRTAPGAAVAAPVGPAKKASKGSAWDDAFSEAMAEQNIAIR